MKLMLTANERCIRKIGHGLICSKKSDIGQTRMYFLPSCMLIMQLSLDASIYAISETLILLNLPFEIGIMILSEHGRYGQLDK